MGHATPEGGSASALAAPKRAAVTLLVSLSTLVALCGKQASRASKKLKLKQLPCVCPKRLLKSVGAMAITLMHKKKASRRLDKEEEWGDGGVWQKTILMGDKCQPLDFSGVIYYDSDGTQLKEVPLRSPRASPLPGFAYSHHKVY